MTQDRSIDLFILVLNVLAIMVLVGILSVMVNTADAKQLAGRQEVNAQSVEANARLVKVSTEPAVEARDF